MRMIRTLLMALGIIFCISPIVIIKFGEHYNIKIGISAFGVGFIVLSASAITFRRFVGSITILFSSLCLAEFAKVVGALRDTPWYIALGALVIGSCLFTIAAMLLIEEREEKLIKNV